jgi:GNAT superfamily N-acetyltransferase
MCIWEDSTGKVLAFGALRIPQEDVEPLDGGLWFRIHPEVRGQGLMSDVLAWAEQRMRTIGRDRQVTVQLRAGSRATLHDRIQGLEAHGFQQDRCFHHLWRSLAIPVPASVLPEGFTIREHYGADEADKWVAMFNQSFVDHWNHHPLTVERHLHWLKDPDYRTDLDLVAIAPDGTLAGFCYGSIDPAYNEQKDCKEGWIDLLGTRRGFRRKGLGRALLLEGLRRLKTATMDTVKIGVDSQNPNRADVLYQSVGFQMLYSGLSFVKSLD